MKTAYLICALLPLLLLNGCSLSQTPASGTYTVAELDGAQVTIQPPIIVRYEDNKLAGKGPVNNWTTAVQEDGRLGIVISTRMAGAPELMAQEAKLLQALEGGTLEAASGKDLAIVKEGRPVLILQPASQE